MIGLQGGNVFPAQSDARTPGPDFWSWSPPPDTKSTPQEDLTLEPARSSSSSPNSSGSLLEKEPALEFLAIPFESSEQEHSPPLPPFQSLMGIEKPDSKISNSDLSSASNEHKLEVLFSRNATEAAEALGKANEASLHGVNPDGSKWWRETGKEQRPDGVVCRWTLTRGVSADGSVEWEDKFWEASDQFDYKELGSEKCGRDAAGNVWREYWRESMWQVTSLLSIIIVFLIAAHYCHIIRPMGMPLQMQPLSFLFITISHFYSIFPLFCY